MKLHFSSHLTHFIPLFSCYSHLKAQKPDSCSFLSFHVWYPSLLTILFDYRNYFIFLWYILWFCLVYNYMYWGSSHYYGVCTQFVQSYCHFHLPKFIVCVIVIMIFSKLFVHQALLLPRLPRLVTGSMFLISFPTDPHTAFFILPGRSSHSSRPPDSLLTPLLFLLLISFMFFPQSRHLPSKECGFYQKGWPSRWGRPEMLPRVSHGTVITQLSHSVWPLDHHYSLSSLLPLWWHPNKGGDAEQTRQENPESTQARPQSPSRIISPGFITSPSEEVSSMQGTRHSSITSLQVSLFFLE